MGVCLLFALPTLTARFRNKVTEEADVSFTETEQEISEPKESEDVFDDKREEVPAAEEEPVAEEETAAEEEPVAEEEPEYEVEEELTVEDEPATEEETAAEEEPVVEEAPEYEVEEELTVEDEPANEEEPVAEEEPVVEEETGADESMRYDAAAQVETEAEDVPAESGTPVREPEAFDAHMAADQMIELTMRLNRGEIDEATYNRMREDIINRLI